MQTVERNPRFTNPLAQSTSPYLKQHANNPVFWYPWGTEALERSYFENKPILLSIGYSTCYWCHIMERDVFENLSIASQMNRCFINIKVDREEHPELDEIYMVARQIMTREGGWPNNVFLTPDLKPFYAGGTFGPSEAHGRPGFPQILEWLNYNWTTQEEEVRRMADIAAEEMQPYLVIGPRENPNTKTAMEKADDLYTLLKQNYDMRGGGFFHAPKFPHETFLSFMLTYFEYTGKIDALDMSAFSLGKMAAGGIYDHVGCGFHRYAVDKEWYVPHFEKMLYNQALLARLYTDAARITGNAYFADIARSVLDFVSGPMTDGGGGFYAAIDAESEFTEGAYYVWTAEELQEILTPEEAQFMITFYALADLPQFPGHKHANGQVIIARKPLAQAAVDAGMPYVQLMAMSGGIMNKLLNVRNERKAPNLDDKIIVSWNGLMIDAYAHAGLVFTRPLYTNLAKKAADYILEQGLDNEGKLSRIIIGGRAHTPATLEDYAYLIKGLITLWRASQEDIYLESAKNLTETANDLFLDAGDQGYFYTQNAEQVLFRIKNMEDSVLPNACAVMLQNLVSLADITKETHYIDLAKNISQFLLGASDRNMVEYAGLIEASLALDRLLGVKPSTELPALFELNKPAESLQPAPSEIVNIITSINPHDAKPGENCELIIMLDIKPGWHINASRVLSPSLVPTQADVQGEGFDLLGVFYPTPIRHNVMPDQPARLVYEEQAQIVARIKLHEGTQRPDFNVRIRFQPCSDRTCHAIEDYTITI